MSLDNPVSFRQFAKMVGLGSDNSVRKAVERGSIVDGVTEDRKIIPRIAAEEWGKEILPEYFKNAAGPEKESPKPKAKKPKPNNSDDKPEPQTAAAIVKDIMSEKLPRVKKEEVAAAPDDDEFENEETDISDKIKKPEAERRTAILKAKMMQLAYKEKKGLLIPREKIASVLFAYGLEIRTALEGLSNRSIDNILACQTREEAKRILDSEIHLLLNDIADIVKQDFV